MATDDEELRLGCRDILFISVGVAGAYLLRGFIILSAFAIPIVKAGTIEVFRVRATRRRP